MKHPILSPEEIEWAYEKWCLGYPQEDIAKALYVHPNTIGKALKGRKKQRPPLHYPGFCGDKLFVTNVRTKES